MERGPKTATEFEAVVKTAIADAKWNGLSKDAIRAILRSAAETT